jgi:hypothetical protein
MLDFPRAWQITIASNIDDHHKKCSWRVARMLCDCHIVYKHPEFLSDLFIGKNGEIIMNWARKELRHMWE